MTKVLSKKDTALALALLNHLESKEESQAFREPVDYEDLGLDDYPKIIKHPMDLSTVRGKLVSGKYRSFRSFQGDLKLIWSNCRLYNETSSQITRQANELERWAAEFVEHYNSVERGKWRTMGDPDRVSLEEKVELLMDARELRKPELVELGKMLKAEFPAAYEQLDFERFRVKLDSLTRAAFLRVYSFIKEHTLDLDHCLLKKPKKSP